MTAVRERHAVARGTIVDEYIQPLMDATEKTFELMLSQGVRFYDPTPINKFPSTAGVSGIIGLSGDVIGAVAISFPTKTAQTVINKFCGMEVALDSEDFTDAVGEIANMIAGATKAEFFGKDVKISCPTVIVGEGHTIQRPSGAQCICIPCESDLGRFIVEIAIAQNMPESARLAG